MKMPHRRMSATRISEESHLPRHELNYLSSEQPPLGCASLLDPFRLLSYQFLSHQLTQKAPGTPSDKGRYHSRAGDLTPGFAQVGMRSWRTQGGGNRVLGSSICLQERTLDLVQVIDSNGAARGELSLLVKEPKRGSDCDTRMTLRY